MQILDDSLVFEISLSSSLNFFQNNQIRWQKERGPAEISQNFFLAYVFEVVLTQNWMMRSHKQKRTSLSKSRKFLK